MKFHRYSLLFAIALISFQNSKAQGQIKAEWSKNFKITLNSINKAIDLQVDSLGNSFVLMQSWTPDSVKQIVLVKYDAEGKLIWQRIYDHSSRGDDIPASFAIDDFGNIWICGITKTTDLNGNFLVVRFSTDGVQDVDFTYDGREHLFDAANAISTDKFGNAYAGGYTTSKDSTLDAFLVKLKPDGKLEWKRNYVSAKVDIINSLVVDDSSNIYVSGVTNNGQRSSDIFIQKYNSGGDLKWQRIYDGVFGERDMSNIITRDDSMHVYITGFVNHTSDRSDLPVLKYSRNGLLLAESFFNGVAADCFATSLRIEKDKIILTGNKVDYTTNVSESLYLKYDKAGKEKLFIKSKNDFKFLSTEVIGSHELLFGTELTHPESTLIPFIAEVDTLPRFKWTYSDSTLYGVAHFIKVVVNKNKIYFLADDAGDASGTVILAKYDLTFPPEKKELINYRKQINKSGVQKNK